MRGAPSSAMSPSWKCRQRGRSFGMRAPGGGTTTSSLRLSIAKLWSRRTEATRRLMLAPTDGVFSRRGASRCTALSTASTRDATVLPLGSSNRAPSSFRSQRTDSRRASRRGLPECEFRKESRKESRKEPRKEPRKGRVGPLEPRRAHQCVVRAHQCVARRRSPL